jgi:transcriptional regulator with XRE-family HTH domain
MDFSKKIDLLMKMTHIRNNQLALAIGVDPSLVSRWRTGSRELNLTSPYLNKICAFFAENAKEDYQKLALLELTGNTYENQDITIMKLTTVLEKWFVGESKIDSEDIVNLLEAIKGGQIVPSFSKESLDLPHLQVGTKINATRYVGKGGLRTATFKLLELALSSRKNQTLYLFSNENLAWLIEEPSFAKTWSALFGEALKRGLKVKIIHSLDRKKVELDAAIQRWIPLYMSGAITSYFYPHRDIIEMNYTMVILDGECSIFSTSHRNQDPNGISYFLSTDNGVTDSIKGLYLERLKECKVLIKTLSGAKYNSLLDNFSPFLEGEHGFALGFQSLLLLTTPPSVIESMATRSGIDPNLASEIVENQKKRFNQFSDSLKHRTYKFFLALPRVTTISKGELISVNAQLLFQKLVTYTPKEFHLHLKEIVKLYQKYSNLEIFILPTKKLVTSVPIIGAKNNTALVIKHHHPKIAFRSEQPDFVEALIQFINSHINSVPKSQRGRGYVLNRLDYYLNRFANS